MQIEASALGRVYLSNDLSKHASHGRLEKRARTLKCVRHLDLEVHSHHKCTGLPAINDEHKIRTQRVFFYRHLFCSGPLTNLFHFTSLSLCFTSHYHIFKGTCTQHRQLLLLSIISNFFSFELLSTPRKGSFKFHLKDKSHLKQ